VTDRFRERRDGVKIVATPGVRKSVWLIAGAAALVALAVLVLARSARIPLEAAPPAPPAAPEVAVVAAAAPARDAANAKPAAPRHARRIARPAADTPAPADAVPGDPALPPSHDDVPFSLGKPGEKSGIALFPAHGTKPIKIGIVVPDDFELPEGYVRHYQATDDGQLLPAILLFHPDYEWVDDAGNAIELPPDRVVPPELAPPGLPIQMLEVRDEKGGAN
jgi:hypothetical protein